tara:strand:+ start:1179 stop:1661 length:483 start_codon:yes stop_codon:yes gene_type:complete
LIFLDSKGPIFYKTNRIGKNKKIFRMYKFRTMKIDAPIIDSNQLQDAEKYITKLGKNLRKYSIDEIPQIINILQGHMSLVGPRPALDTQHDLIEKRDLHGIHIIRPGVTGLAQINGRDNLSVDKKVEYDNFYKNNQTIILDIKILIQTILVVLKSEDIKH